MQFIILRLSLLLTIFVCVWTSLIGGCAPQPAPEYTWEDLQRYARNNTKSFSFDASTRPLDAVADLPESTPDSFVATIPDFQMGIIRGGIRPYSEIVFPWGALKKQLNKGDIVFQRGGGVGYLIRWISSFTHVAMVWDKDKREVFESQKSRGVDVYNSDESWAKAVTWAVKRVKGLHPKTIELILDNAMSRYGYGRVPYWPNGTKTSDFSLAGFFGNWSNKGNSDSMYCSKLVWKTFYSYADLDSNRTSFRLISNAEQNDHGATVLHAWSGVSPDDIYYSKHLGPDIHIEGKDYLKASLPSWIL